MGFLEDLVQLLACLAGCKSNADRTSLKQTEPAAAVPDPKTYTGFCRPSGGECEVSCAVRRDCYGFHNPELCLQSDPSGGEFACYRKSAADPEVQEPVRK